MQIKAFSELFPSLILPIQRHWNSYCLLSAVKLANVLVSLAENYGPATEIGIEIYNIPIKYLADVADISPQDTARIMDKLNSKDWVKSEPERQALYLTNLKQLTHLAEQD